VSGGSRVMRRISGIAACAAQTGGQSTQDPPLYATRRFESYDSVPAGSPISLNNVRKFEADGLQVAVCVAQGGRPYQEDSWLVMSKEPPRNSNGWWFSAGQPPAPPATTSTGIEQPTILAVFDGHGGAECSRFLTQEFPALFEGASSSDDPLLSALLAVDERFARSPANHGRVGSTATVLSIDSQFLRCASAGDSRAILIRKGTVVDLSSDHSPDLRPDEISRIETAGGMLSRGGVLTQALFYLATGERPCLRVYHRFTGEGGLNMTRAIGDSYLKPLVIATPELTCIPRHRDDAFVVLASDGLW
jgi:serine/threonine protein phosphatase PrpC